MGQEILRVNNLKKYFNTPSGLLHAVDDVSFTLEKGKTLGIVGESGCGKSTMGRCIASLLSPTSGDIIFEGENITAYNKKRVKQLRNDIQLIFQDPFSSLNPRRSLAETIEEPFVIQNTYKSKKERSKKVSELMELVGLSSRLINAYPHELDGGRRQRIGIARALALNPKLIVCDEPVSALDVSIQAQILNLLKQLQKDLGLTYIFITHDLSVVRHFSDDIAVMYLGKLVEKADAKELFKKPVHSYTKALLSAIPVPDIDAKRERIILKGEITSPINPGDGCRFAPRCINSSTTCSKVSPELVEIGHQHFVRCNKCGTIKAL